MVFKVRDGTASGSGSTLCATCRHSIVVRGQTLDEEFVQCRATPMGVTRVTFKVTSCSAYMDHKQPTYMEMMQEAWILQPGSKKRKAGFIRASDLREEELASVMFDIRQQEDD
jgi:prophage tail gpP-like protein